jgi:hypothetical protein
MAYLGYEHMSRDRRLCVNRSRAKQRVLGSPLRVTVHPALALASAYESDR